MGFGSRHYFQTVGAPAVASSFLDKPRRILLPADPDQDKTLVSDFEIADWGTGNRFPDTSDELISKIGVLNTGLKFIRNFTLGQGIYPVRVVGYVKGFSEDNGNMIYLSTYFNYVWTDIKINIVLNQHD